MPIRNFKDIYVNPDHIVMVTREDTVSGFKLIVLLTTLDRHIVRYEHTTAGEEEYANDLRLLLSLSNSAQTS